MLSGELLNVDVLVADGALRDSGRATCAACCVGAFPYVLACSDYGVCGLVVKQVHEVRFV